MGASDDASCSFSCAQKNEAQRTGLSILWDGQPLASDCRSISFWSLLFRHNAVQSASWLARPEPFCLDFVMTQAEAWIHKRAPNANVRFPPRSGHKWVGRGMSAFDSKRTWAQFAQLAALISNSAGMGFYDHGAVDAESGTVCVVWYATFLTVGDKKRAWSS